MGDWYYDWSDLHAQLNRIEWKLNVLIKKENEMAIDLTKAAAEIARNTDVANSAVLLIQKLVGMIQAIPASDDPVTQAALDALVATLSANDATLGAAVANTPQTPVPVPPVVVPSA